MTLLKGDILQNQKYIQQAEKHLQDASKEVLEISIEIMNIRTNSSFGIKYNLIKQLRRFRKDWNASKIFYQNLIERLKQKDKDMRFFQEHAA